MEQKRPAPAIELLRRYAKSSEVSEEDLAHVACARPLSAACASVERGATHRRRGWATGSVVTDRRLTGCYAVVWFGLRSWRGLRVPPRTARRTACGARAELSVHRTAHRVVNS